MPVGTIISVDGWTGYQGVTPEPDDLGCLWYVKDFSGWYGLDAPRVDSTDNPVDDGTLDGDSTQPGRTLTITGEVRAPDQISLLMAADRGSQLLVMGSRYGTLTVTEPHLTRHMTVRRGAESLIDPTSVITADFSHILYAPKPQRLGDEIVDSTLLPVSTGGMSYPYSYPYSFGGSVITGQIGIVNPGGFNGPLRLRVDGPCTGPIITHVASGKTLIFASDYHLAVGNWLDIDMNRHEILENGQASRLGSVVQRGWFSFEPGDNTFGFNAAVYDPASRLTVYATPAW